MWIWINVAGDDSQEKLEKLCILWRYCEGCRTCCRTWCLASFQCWNGLKWFEGLHQRTQFILTLLIWIVENDGYDSSVSQEWRDGNYSTSGYNQCSISQYIIVFAPGTTGCICFKNLELHIFLCIEHQQCRCTCLQDCFFPDRTPDLVLMGTITIYREQQSCCWKSWALTFVQRSRIGETSPLGSIRFGFSHCRRLNPQLGKTLGHPKMPKAYAPKMSLNHLYKYPKFDWTLCEALEHFGSNPNIAKLLCCLEMFRTCSVVALVQAFVPLRGPTPQFILTLVMASGPHGGPCPAAQTGSSGLRLWDTDRHSLHHCGP